MRDTLRTELMRINELIDMLEMALEGCEDKQLEKRIDKLNEERDELIRQLQILN
jgi:hypothetical protein